MKKPRLRDPEGAAKRAAVARRRVGEGARCACGEARPLALIRGSNPIICAKCQRQERGHTVMDKHHPFGEANNPKTTILVPVNDHRAELNEAQNDWLKQTRENPDGSPLLAAAGTIRGFIDQILYLIDKGLNWVADMLEELDDWLKGKFGPNYWGTARNYTLGPGARGLRSTADSIGQLRSSRLVRNPVLANQLWCDAPQYID